MKRTSRHTNSFSGQYGGFPPHRASEGPKARGRMARVGAMKGAGGGKAINDFSVAERMEGRSPPFLFMPYMPKHCSVTSFLVTMRQIQACERTRQA